MRSTSLNLRIPARGSATVCLLILFSVCGHGQQMPAMVDLQIDGSKTFQRFDGIGVNANTRSWGDTSLEPAINLLLDSVHATIWRVIVESVEKWEDVNDNKDPFTFNWKYYNTLYETPKFRKVWDMIGYLNRRGITKNLSINFMGAVPLWMGGEVVKPAFEDEYIEMLVSFFYYARNVKHLEIGSISPMNEPDIRKEGPTVGPEQYARLVKKFLLRMSASGLGDIPFIGPDVAGMETGIGTYIPLLMKDPDIMKQLVHVGLHSYAGYYAPVDSVLKASSYPNTTYWITEWNEWCKGCDDGILGEYNYDFGRRSVSHLLDLLDHGASAGIAWEAYDSYYEHHAPSPFSYWGMLAYAPSTHSYHARKNFYAVQQVSRFIPPGARRIHSTFSSDSLKAIAFYDSSSHTITVVGVNQRRQSIQLNSTLSGLPLLNDLELYYTNETNNVKEGVRPAIGGKTFVSVIPENCIFTLTGHTDASGETSYLSQRPEPSGWYSGDIHVHKNCGGVDVLPESMLTDLMEKNNLAVISLLADMGNGEVLDSETDLLKVTGKDAPQSAQGRVVHWDAEWHWDATYSRFEHQALGGHLVLLGLTSAQQRWEASTYKILEWAGQQNAIRGFCHFQYLNDKIQNELNCCIPIEYPVEAALGNIDFISEDVYSASMPGNDGTYNSEAAMQAYYKLLNCGFRLGLAAGTDYPCNNYEPLGSLLTYVQVKDAPFDYRRWVEGIKKGRTVVARNGHREFLDLKINGTSGPGDEIKLKNKGAVAANVVWTATTELSGQIELVLNGQVVGTKKGTVTPNSPITFDIPIDISKSGWVCARRMDERGHQTHTAPVYITVREKPVRANAADAEFFITWIDNMLVKTAPGGEWSRYFTKDLDIVHQRYRKAKAVYEKIRKEAQ